MEKGLLTPHSIKTLSYTTYVKQFDILSTSRAAYVCLAPKKVVSWIISKFRFAPVVAISGTFLNLLVSDTYCKNTSKHCTTKCRAAQVCIKAASRA